MYDFEIGLTREVDVHFCGKNEKIMEPEIYANAPSPSKSANHDFSREYRDG
jgi:hypothetical protein